MNHSGRADGGASFVWARSWKARPSQPLPRVLSRRHRRRHSADLRSEATDQGRRRRRHRRTGVSFRRHPGGRGHLVPQQGSFFHQYVIRLCLFILQQIRHEQWQNKGVNANGNVFGGTTFNANVNANVFLGRLFNGNANVNSFSGTLSMPMSMAIPDALPQCQ